MLTGPSPKFHGTRDILRALTDLHIADKRGRSHGPSETVGSFLVQLVLILSIAPMTTATSQSMPTTASPGLTSGPR